MSPLHRFTNGLKRRVAVRTKTFQNDDTSLFSRINYLVYNYKPAIFGGYDDPQQYLKTLLVDFGHNALAEANKQEIMMNLIS